MNALKAWYFGLQQRERWIVSIGAAAAVVIIVSWLMASLVAQMDTLRTAVDTKQRLLIDVARIEATQPSGVVSRRQENNEPLYLLISNTAPSYGLEQPRTRQNGPSGVDVTLQNASFDALMAWLVALHGMYGVDVETFSITNARDPGLVSGTLLLRRL
ncbi:MAG TPA: type II secretion system protein GspM [Gammaproteobacteria bacterium]|jgi:type II secretory pathway component PulM|nr:type II secretion system protein GspM [Gammaproteobacteria bacterium]